LPQAKAAAPARQVTPVKLARRVRMPDPIRRRTTAGKVALGKVALGKVALGKVAPGKGEPGKVALGKVAPGKVAPGKVEPEAPARRRISEPHADRTAIAAPD
jgi:hypothetical protein